MINKNAAALAVREECGLVIIDIQEKLLPVMSDKEMVLENASRLAGFASLVGLPVILTEQDKLGPTVPELASLAPNAPVCAKITFDCCAEDSFSQALKEMNRSTLVLSGIESHICLAQTALSLLADYNVHIISDAVSSRSPLNKQTALTRLAQAGAVISSTEMFIYEILRQAGTDEFRAALKMVK